jgi:hypothetical protein
MSVEVSGRPLSSDIDKLTADKMAPLALEDSMYYHFDEWFVRFQAEINRLESATPSKENRVEMMKYYFNYAGLLVELTHTLAFTSKYQDFKIAENFIFYSNRVKDLAHKVLDDDTKSIQLISSVEVGIKFCNLMLWEKQDNRNCLKVQEQIDFLKSGGSMVEYDPKK